MASDAVSANPGVVDSGDLLQVSGGLVAVLLLLGLIAWFMRRVVRVQGVAGGALRVIGGLSMGSRERVVLIQVGDRQLLLGVAPGRVQTLHVLDEKVNEQVAGQSAGSFAQSLRVALGREAST